MILSWGGWTAHSRIVRSIPGFYLLDASSTSWKYLQTTKNISKHCQVFPVGQNCPQLRIHALFPTPVAWLQLPTEACSYYLPDMRVLPCMLVIERNFRHVKSAYNSWGRTSLIFDYSVWLNIIRVWHGWGSPRDCLYQDAPILITLQCPEKCMSLKDSLIFHSPKML